MRDLRWACRVDQEYERTVAVTMKTLVAAERRIERDEEVGEFANFFGHGLHLRYVCMSGALFR